MWTRLLHYLRCPLCRGRLRLSAIEFAQVPLRDGDAERLAAVGFAGQAHHERVNAGLLLCDACRRAFPIADGVPVMLAYRTHTHEEFARRHSLAVARAGYAFADLPPAPGEEFVLRSFSREWGDYSYDGVIWEMTYPDHYRRFQAELGPVNPADVRAFIEIGCGIGITTAMANDLLKCDAVGVDLSSAAAQAERQFGANPFLHFVQASAFRLPFATGVFAVVYSRGVLHHTYSTEQAVAQVAQLCAGKGLFYLWVYSTGSIAETPLRRIAYATERVLRPVLSRDPNGMLADAVLHGVAVPYVAYNRWRRFRDPSIQPLTFGRAVHAARDRFTPEFAHRHPPDEVLGWFREQGFPQPEVVKWEAMPTADHDDYRRNVGVRGRRA